MRPTDEKLIDSLMDAPSIAQAARECGVSRSTVYERMKRPDFSKALETAIQERRRATSAIAAHAVERATEALLELVTEPGVTDSERIRAAGVILKTFWNPGIFDRGKDEGSECRSSYP